MSSPLYISEPWSGTDRWHRFIFPATRARSFTQSMAIDGAPGTVVLVQHGDLECRFSCPPRTGEAVTFYDEPWRNPASAATYGTPHAKTPDGPRCLALETDLAEADRDASSVKLERLLTALAKKTTTEDVILLSSTCLPSKLGDDARMGALLERAALPATVLYNDPDVDQAVPPTARLLRERLRRGTAAERPAQERTINLVGFPRVPEKAELVAFLREIGVTVNVELLPDVALDALDRFGCAPLTVLFPERHLAKVYEHVFDGLPTRCIQPPAPYGLRASRRWLLAIAKALNVRDALDRHWNDWVAATRGRLESLRHAVRGRNVGLIGSRSEIQSLASPEDTQGVALLPLLEELGFGARWLERGAQTDDPGPDGMTRMQFQTREELWELVRSSDCDLFYSDIAWDERITRCGKIPLALSAFRMGPQGFLRTAEELLRRCRLPFYSRYREVLP